MDFDLTRPELAYLMGFLFGDGHLWSGRGQKGRLAVEVHVRDAELLERLAPLLPGSTLSSRTRTTNFSRGDYETAILSCSGLEVRKAVAAAGMPVGAKNALISPPKGPHSLRDFARGFCDADGSLGFTGRGLPYLSLVTKSATMADWWCASVIPHSGVTRSWNPNRRDGVANIMVMNEPAQALAAWLYRSGDLALARKAAAATRMAGWRRPPEMRRASRARRWTAAEDAILREGGRTQMELASLLGRTVPSVNVRMWRLRNAP